MVKKLNDLTKAERQKEKQTENLKELFMLIRKHQDLPILPMVDSDIVSDDYGWWMGSWGDCLIDKYILHEDYGIIFYEEGNPDTVDIFEKYFDYAECGISEEMSDEEVLPLMRKKIDTLNWTEAIIVFIKSPETESQEE